VELFAKNTFFGHVGYSQPGYEPNWVLLKAGPWAQCPRPASQFTSHGPV